MNLREEILGRVSDTTKLSDSIVFSTVIKAFSHDYQIMGEEIVDVYTDVFGESTRELFEALVDDPQQLVEFAGRYEGSMLLEASDEDIGDFYLAELGPAQSKSIDDLPAPKRVSGGLKNTQKISGNLKNIRGSNFKDAEAKRPAEDAWMGHGGPVPAGGYGKTNNVGGDIAGLRELKAGTDSLKAGAETATAAATVTKAVASKGWIAKIWDKIKQSGLGIKEFFKNNPALLKTLGIASGVGVGALAIAKIAKMIKDKKAQKQQLQTRQA